MKALVVGLEVEVPRIAISVGVALFESAAPGGDVSVKIEQVRTGFGAKDDFGSSQEIKPGGSVDTILPAARNVELEIGSQARRSRDVIAEAPLFIPQPSELERLNRTAVGDVHRPLGHRPTDESAQRRREVAGVGVKEINISNHLARIDLHQLVGSDASDHDVDFLLSDVFGKPARLDVLILLHQDLQAVERLEGSVQLSGRHSGRNS
jgi:hypothetical protein